MIARINHPGIIFPERVKMDKPPVWGMTTKDASRVLGTSPSGARQYLSRHDAKCVFVKKRCYWNYYEVSFLAASKPAVSDGLPNGWLTTKEASALLGVKRSRLYAMVRRGLLKEERRFRIRGKRGFRVVHGYSEGELGRLKLARENGKEIS